MPDEPEEEPNRYVLAAQGLTPPPEDGPKGVGSDSVKPVKKPRKARATKKK